jgi:hypothetical protein
VGLNKVDFIGQTGSERSYEDGQRIPGDYEAQISQGPIAIHKLEHLGHTDTGVALLRNMLRRAIRNVKAGKEPARPSKNADGHAPTMTGDVIVKVPNSNIDDREMRRDLGRKIGAIVADTMPLSQAERAEVIEQRVRALLDT